jgi:TolB protein
MGAATLALVLVLGGPGVRSQEKPRSGLRPTLVLLASGLPDAGASLDAVRRFTATALRDLKESGAFHLLDAGEPRDGDADSLGFWRKAGANLLVRFASRSLAQGRLLIESELINLETGAVVLKKSYMGETAASTRMAHRMSDFVVGKVTGTQGVADSTIVVARATGPGLQEIFGLDRDGRSPRQLTFFNSLTTRPALAADGRLAFVTYKGGPPQIWGQLRPQDRFQRLFPAEGAPGLELSGLAWSPDGTRLCFVQEDRKGQAAIHLLDLRSGRTVQLTGTGHSSSCPSWSPDGAELAFLSDQGGTPQVYRMASDGSRVRQLTSDPGAKTCVAWNAQGDRIGYAAAADGGTGLFIMSADGTGRQKLAASAEPLESLCWAPDGRWLLFGLRAADGARLRVAGLDGKVRDLGDGPGGGQFPQWAQNPVPVAALAQPAQLSASPPGMRGTDRPVPTFPGPAHGGAALSP